MSLASLNRGLDRAAVRVQSLMQDSCTVIRGGDPGTSGGPPGTVDTLDPTTLRLHVPLVSMGGTVVYMGLFLLVPPGNATPPDEGQTPVEKFSTAYARALFPTTCPEIKVYDVLTVSSCVRDPAMNGKELLVTAVKHDSLTVVREVTVRERA